MTTAPREPRDVRALRHDSALHSFELLDPSCVSRLLARTGVTTDSVRLRYLEHEPGRHLSSWYRVELDGGRSHDLAMVVDVDADPPSGVLPNTWRAVPAGLLPEGVVAGVEDVEGVTLSWFPFDLGLPAAVELVAAGEAARWASLPGDTRVDRLAWVPRRRLVLGVGDRVVKVDAEPERAAWGVETLRRLGTLDGLLVPEVMDHDAAGGLFVQRRLPGRVAERSDALPRSEEAGQIAASLGAVDHRGLPVLDALALLEACEPVIALVEFERPDLAPRISAIVDLLRSSAPTSNVVPNHGDYNISQLLIGPDGRLGLVDTDTLALAPPGFDLASYAANLVAGRDGDLEDARRSLELLRSGFGQPVPDIDWIFAVCVLRRLDRPIRRFKRRWSDRVDRLVGDLESVANGSS